MALQIPDKWVMLRIVDENGEAVDKILSSYYGGYGGSNSWKLSSGTKESFEFEDYYEFHQHSGAIYRCYKNSYGMSMYTSSILFQWLEMLKEGMSITPLTEEEIRELLH